MNGDRNIKGLSDALAGNFGRVHFASPLTSADIRPFVRESNRIEGIARAPLKREIDAHLSLLAEPSVSVMLLSRFVSAVQPGAELRIRPGMDVRVGNHRPPPGGSGIGFDLFQILDGASHGADPYATHQAYETLHPFMDGNGRSGRALWLWMMLRHGRDPYILRRGFLWTWYYQSLEDRHA